MKTPDTFALFFAIFWGLVSNVQPRWKAFQWPLAFSNGFVCKRVLVSVFWMNVVPVAFFGIIVHCLHSTTLGRREDASGLVLYGVLPAFAIFGFYRLWLATIELKPTRYYGTDWPRTKGGNVVEPTVDDLWARNTADKLQKSPGSNFLAAVLYLAVAVGPFVLHRLGWINW